MALLHKATLRPTKLELLAAWLPGREWYDGPAGEVLRVASYRFDDPADAVGIETMLVRVGDGPVHQVPLTYRDAPLPDGEDRLLGTAEHSVLGRRWIYDGPGDPAYAAALASAILDDTGQAEQVVAGVDGRLERREPDMSIASGTGGAVGGTAGGMVMGTVRGAAGGVKAAAAGAIRRVVEGDPTLIVTDTVELDVVRRLDAGTGLTGAVLTGSWPGRAAAVPLAAARPRSAADLGRSAGSRADADPGDYV
ncbi:CG0192-related protein [Streptosporangium sp. DT93]|uniref:CG0192-related protein n=1 Tax=Streptosporangium sp. DT93 TaxID=3393428 RepID=UPI003CED3039